MLAAALGVADVDAPDLQRARELFPSWRQEEPDLAVVDDLLDLYEWSLVVDHGAATKDRVLAALVRLRRQEPTATTAVAWLLLPGAVRLARSLLNLAPDIDELVAAHLWIAARTFDEARWPRVYGGILGQTRTAVHAELGVGSAARRRDRVWAIARHSIRRPWQLPRSRM